MSSAIETNRCGTALVRNELYCVDEANKLENDRLRNTIMQQAEHINVLEIKNNILHLNIDGVPEDANVAPALLIITKFNNDTDAGLAMDDFKTAWRVGTYFPDTANANTKAGEENEKGVDTGEPKAEAKMKTNKRKPRTISVILASEAARDKIMSIRSKLSKYEDGSYMWINEDQPESYRRRKMMLRDLVKFARKKGYKDAKVENGDRKVGGILYTPDRFEELPEEIKPKQVRTRKTKNND